MVAVLVPPDSGTELWAEAGPGPPLTVVGGEVAVTRDPETDGGAFEMEECAEGGYLEGGYGGLPAEAVTEEGPALSFAGNVAVENLRPSGSDAGGDGGTTAGLAVVGSDIRIGATKWMSRLGRAISLVNVQIGSRMGEGGETTIGIGNVEIIVMGRCTV